MGRTPQIDRSQFILRACAYGLISLLLLLLTVLGLALLTGVQGNLGRLVGLSLLILLLWIVSRQLRGLGRCIITGGTIDMDGEVLSYRTWYGAQRHMRWADVDSVTFSGERWNCGPLSRYVFDGRLILEAENYSVVVELGNYRRPRQVLRLFGERLQRSAPERRAGDFLAALDQVVSSIQTTSGLYRAMKESWSAGDGSPALLRGHARRDFIRFGLIPLLGSVLFSVLMTVAYRDMTDWGTWVGCFWVAFLISTVLVGRHAAKIFQALDTLVLVREAAHRKTPQEEGMSYRTE